MGLGHLHIDALDALDLLDFGPLHALDRLRLLDPLDLLGLHLLDFRAPELGTLGFGLLHFGTVHFDVRDSEARRQINLRKPPKVLQTA